MTTNFQNSGDAENSRASYCTSSVLNIPFQNDRVVKQQALIITPNQERDKKIKSAHTANKEAGR
jgi:hypothetical protein